MIGKSKRFVAKSFVRLPFLGLLFLLLAGFNRSNGSLEHQILRDVLKNLNNHHYELFEDSNEHSKRIYHLFLRQLDSSKLLFAQKEIDHLKLYEEVIDDHLREWRFEVMTSFFDEVVNKHKMAIDRAERIVNGLLSSHVFDYEREETINLDHDNKGYAADDEGLRDRWRKHLKRLLMDQMSILEERSKSASEESEEIEGSVDAPPKEAPNPMPEELKEQALQEVRKTMGLYFERVGKVTDRERFNQYVDAIALSYDPHTAYHPPIERDQFNESMRGEFQGIGAHLRQEGDHVKITKIVVGGPAYRQKQLKAGDIILKIAQGDEEPVSAIGMNVSDAAQIIRGPKGTVVKLTVKRNGNEIVEIPIIRGTVKLEQSSARSSVGHLEANPNNPYGYLRLPLFYRDFQNRRTGRSSARDVEKELKKLIDKQVDGIVFDLRNNGGGSLPDAIDIVGLFVGARPLPVVAVNGRNNRRQVHKFERSLSSPLPYKGPLVVMVNEGSASASEIVSAALQDYGRAVIVGSTTFGKGTVQRIMRLGGRNTSKMGSLRVTMQKFYRISGETTQYKGVTPDIIFPTPLSLVGVTSEKEYLYSIPWDTIQPASYNPVLNFTDDVEAELSRKHKERTDNNPTFAFLRSNHDAFEVFYEAKEIPLKRSTYLERRSKARSWENELKNIGEQSPQKINMLLPEFSESQKQDEAYEDRKLLVQEWNEQLEKDPFIQEAFFILDDLAKHSSGASKTFDSSPQGPN